MKFKDLKIGDFFMWKNQERSIMPSSVIAVKQTEDRYRYISSGDSYYEITSTGRGKEDLCKVELSVKRVMTMEELKPGQRFKISRCGEEIYTRINDGLGRYSCLNSFGAAQSYKLTEEITLVEN